MNTQISKLTKILKDSNNIVFFGGAGVSTESNIPDFRSSNGLWNEKLKINLTPEQLVSHTMYMRYHEEFFKFYKEKLIYPDAKPNAAHIALAKLEKMGKVKAVVTHGSVLRNYCMKCHAFYDEKFILESEGIPTCPKCGGKVKPDVILYEEGLDNSTIRGAVNAIANADTLIIGGTSLVVYPAAGLIDYFRGKNIVLINKSSTSADNKANLVIHDAIGKVLAQAVNEL